ncbi:MAG: glycosyltransferase family 39 protein [Caldilineaceae bacterium]|nr:glycosyltransferase family 39 protein [Caldilineaceae bacterium]
MPRKNAHHPSSAARWLPLLLTLCALLIVGAIYQRAIRPAGGMGWDQASHALRGLNLAYDVEQRDVMGLMYDIYRQVYWPPVHTIALGSAFTLFGAGVLTARSVSLLFFLLGAAALYACGASLGRRNQQIQRGPVLGFIAAALYLTAPALTPYAGQVMLEIPALAVMYLAVWRFLRLEEDSPLSDYVWLGLSIALTFLTKLNYGVLLMAVVALELFIRAHGRPRRMFNRRLLALALAVSGPLAFWFAYPPKLMRTWEALLNQPFGAQDAFSAAGLLYYPRALVALSGSPLLFALFMVGLLYALSKMRRNRGLRILALIVLLQFTLGQLHQTKVDRHLFPLLPALYLSMAALMTDALLFARLSLPRPSRLSQAAALLLLLYSTWLFGVNLRPVSRQPDYPAAAAIAARLNPDEPALIVGTINLTRPAPPQLDWSLAAEFDVLPVTLSDVAMNIEQDASVAGLAKKLPGPEALRAAVTATALRSRSPGPVRTLYLGLSDTGYSRSPDALYRLLEGMEKEGLFTRVFVVTPIDPAKGFMPIGRAPYGTEFITEPLGRLGYVEQERLKFEKENVQVVIY